MEEQTLVETQHFWAIDKTTPTPNLAMWMYWGEGMAHICGPWECAEFMSNLEIVQIIPLPEGYTRENLIYNKLY